MYNDTQVPQVRRGSAQVPGTPQDTRVPDIRACQPRKTTTHPGDGTRVPGVFLIPRVPGYPGNTDGHGIRVQLARVEKNFRSVTLE
eukprot:3429230-Rhodomonas_salina.1